MPDSPVRNLFALPRARWRLAGKLVGFAVLVGVFGFALWLETENILSRRAPPTAWAVWASGLLVAGCAVAALFARWRRWLLVGALSGSGAIVLASVIAATFAPERNELWAPEITAPEVFGAGVLVLLAVRHAAARRASLAVTAVAIALFTTPPLRGPTFGATYPGFLDWAYLGMLMLAAISMGLYMRSLDAARTQQVVQTRREERLAIARDVHDVVAHHVTGIIVQAQAYRTIAEEDPHAAAQALEQIEQAGAEALAAMRKVVGTLRESDSRTLVEATDLGEALEGLVDTSGLDGRLHIRNPADITMSAEASSTLVRVVQEAVTNVRRHAPGATELETVIDIREAGVSLRIRNDGVPSGGTGPDSGGYGLPGLRERVGLLGGRLDAGPVGDDGWLLTVELPLDGRER